MIEIDQRQIGKMYLFRVWESAKMDEHLVAVIRYSPHPVCCGIGMIWGISEVFPGIDTGLRVASERAFEVGHHGALMSTYNVDELDSKGGKLRKLLVQQKWELSSAFDNPIHNNRQMEIYLCYNPNPIATQRRFERDFDIVEGVIVPKGKLIGHTKKLNKEIEYAGGYRGSNSGASYCGGSSGSGVSGKKMGLMSLPQEW